jgi:lactoylglutathione lyase
MLGDAHNLEADFALDLAINNAGPSHMTSATGTLISHSTSTRSNARSATAGLSRRKLVDFARGGVVIACFFIADPDRYQIEVFQRGGTRSLSRAEI